MQKPAEAGYGDQLKFDPIVLGWLGALCVLALIAHLRRRK
jgi:hypothetical protein